MNSTHRVEVVPVDLLPHLNADTLSVVRVFGYQVVVRTADWVDKKVGAYIPPDSVVDVTRPEFAFLASGAKTKYRVAVKRLRGELSFGLLMPAPDGSQVGDDVTEYYGVTHYEPAMRSECVTGGEAEDAPEILRRGAKYDLESLRRYPSLLWLGEQVVITEKIHGANARYAFVDGMMWCGSRNEWKKESSDSIWWKALEMYPQIRELCVVNPNCVLFGEVYGAVQNLNYGRVGIDFAAFDIMGPNGAFASYRDFAAVCDHYRVPRVPVIATLRYEFSMVEAAASGPSYVDGANHYREGVVVKPLNERRDSRLGRVALKIHSPEYLEKS